MEKANSPEQKRMGKNPSEITNHVIWDCGSLLYDSFELKSIEKQLDSAIASRTFSMPHFSDHRRLPLPLPSNKKPATWKVPRSFRRLIRAVFRPKSSTTIITYKNEAIIGRGFGLFDSSTATNSGVPEFYGTLPDQRKSLVRLRTASERFTAVSAATSSLGVFCS